jgi:hypothetical protein
MYPVPEDARYFLLVVTDAHLFAGRGALLPSTAKNVEVTI